MRKQKITANKGVTATSSDIAEASKASAKQHKGGIQGIKEELTNVIELMGPSTPHLSSSTAEDNDESMISTSIYSSVFEVKKMSRKEHKHTSADTPRDISEMSALPIDISETSDAEPKVDNLGHNTETCPCRQYYNAISAISGVNIDTSQPHIQSYQKLQKLVEIKNNKEGGLSFLNLLKFKRQESNVSREPLDLYKINIQHANDHNYPRRLTFDLVDDIPKPNMNTVATNTSKVCVNSPLYCQPVNQTMNPTITPVPTVQIPRIDPKTVGSQTPAKQSFVSNLPGEQPTRVDVYYFDHGNSCYLKTTDTAPVLTTELIAEKTESYTTKFWAEIFGTVHIFFAFITTFLLQFLRFLLQTIVRPLTIGLLQLTSDYFFKPFLTVCFNAVIQPPAIFLFNILTSVRDLCDPIAEGIGYFLREVANICRSMRLVEVKNCRQIDRSLLRRSRLRRKK